MSSGKFSRRRIRHARLGQRLAGQRRGIHADPVAGYQSAIGRHVVALFEQDDIPGHQAARRRRLTNCPSRMTLTCCGSSLRRAAMARSARYSCQKENEPLIRMTATMATPSCHMPSPGLRDSAKKASPAASHRIKAKKCVNSRRKRRHCASPPTASMQLPPYS